MSFPMYQQILVTVVGILLFGGMAARINNPATISEHRTSRHSRRVEIPRGTDCPVFFTREKH